MAAAASPASRCEVFLNIKSTEKGFTIRNIDETIHAHIKNRSDEVVKDAESYRRKQEDIIEMIKGCEVAIFNDERVVYSGREHFNGKTGTLSNILTGSFYYLYYHVIKNVSVEINVKDDLLTLFHAGLVMDFSKLPEQDKIVIQSIIQILLQKAAEQGIELFTPAWWDALVPKLESLKESLMGKEMWHMFHEVFLPDNVTLFRYGPYEDTVDYVTHDFLEWQTAITPDLFKKFIDKTPQIRDLFSPPNDDMALLYGFIGGRRRHGKKMTRRRRQKQHARRSLRNGQKKDFRRRA